ncbi:hypothetical protein CERSUDRAFT_159540 [Gelatoporia subvermispora B]|uniref:LysM domain-containing protein n=1 Tax=Ceriporiopsis subvermispora (strain B) TaxID=914234 RepID=M2QAU9_CERS8|nr:hypothetical protein CERSUDRAFT_159540 [Gelatoporia subvermispora B]
MPAASEIASSLCLACSSSLPPRSLRFPDGDIYVTRCCKRPICPACISSNPRLARYDPCLRCLDGVAAVGGSSLLMAKGNSSPLARTPNIDGSVRDEDVFVLGDEGGEDSEDDNEIPEPTTDTVTPTSEMLGDAPSSAVGPEASQVDTETLSQPMPSRYLIQPRDTLLGIALKVGVDGHTLCRLNNLPPSALRTTPHLLHTRTYLNLPPSVIAPSQQLSADSPDAVARRTRERAEARLQSLAKERDWRVARAYVAIANIPDPEENFKRKESGSLRKRNSKAGDTFTPEVEGAQPLEHRVLDHYMDDNDWEERERTEGRSATLQGFPYFQTKSEAANKDRSWRPWR